MNRKKFLRSVKRELRGLPQSEIAASLQFFDETIAERMERGMNEAEAVAALGNPEDAAGNILSEMPQELRGSVKKNGSFRRALIITTAVFASPIWISLIAAVLAVAVSLAAAYFSIVISLFAVALALVVSALGCVVLMVTHEIIDPMLGIGAGFICAGAAVLVGICAVTAIRLGVGLIRKCCRRKKVSA